jgi:predicted enzyme related to lactoylglutathione lyase
MGKFEWFDLRTTDQEAVADADWATMRAKELGAEVVAGVVQGPAGRFSRIKDPSGAPVALWEPAA